LRIQITAQEDKLHSIEDWLEKTFPKKTVEVKTQVSEELHTANMMYVIDLRGLHADVNALSRKLNALDGVTSASIKVYHEEKEE
jgi:hypothetical protein